MEDQDNDSDYIELKFGPRWTYIGCVRRFVASFFMIGLADKERAEQVSMAASELLENAVKYASKDESYLRIAIHKGRNVVDVCVRNWAEPRQVARLRQEFAMLSAGSPEEVYLRRMEEASKVDDGSSRLGLIRILFETGAKLELETTGEQVTIHAIFDMEQP